MTINAIVVDIEGTIADIAFVKQVLFPYARAALPAFVRNNAANPDVAVHLAAAAETAGVDRDNTEAIIKALLQWIDEDRKVTPLKALQGMVWQAGYANGDYTAHLYDDAYQALQRWRQDALPMYVYSSGSVQAQHLYFAHTTHGNILDWFQGFFDTTSGDKKSSASYQHIASQIGQPAATIRFYSDSAAELAAASEAGWQVVQLCRDGLAADGRFPAITTFDEQAEGLSA
ncbi:MAG: acireductone synthase [Wenzhouxiangellaceae bacterium]